MLGIYVRLSKVDEDSNSIQNQLRQGIKFAEDNGIEYEVYNEGEGLSGGLDETGRPQLNRLLKDVYSDKINAIWIRDQKRIERNQLVFQSIMKLVKSKDLNFFIDDKLTDYNDPNIKFQGSIFSLIAEHQREFQGYQTKKAIEANFKEGKAHGIIPYGYASDENSYLVVKESEAQIVKRIYQLSLNKIGTNKIAEILNSENIPTRYNNLQGTLRTIDRHSGRETIVAKSDIKWSGNSIRGILRNPIYKGERRFRVNSKDEKTFPCPPILEEHFWCDVNINLSKNANSSGKKVNHKYLLKGLLSCGSCGRNYYGHSRVNKKDHTYICSSRRIKGSKCSNRGVHIDRIEELVWNTFVENGKLLAVIEKHYQNTDVDETRNQLEIELKTLEIEFLNNKSNFRKLIDLALSNQFTNEEIAPKKAEINALTNDLEIKIKRLNERLRKLDNSKEELEKIKQNLSKFDRYSFLEKQEILQKYLCDIHIRYYDDKNIFFEGGEYFLQMAFKTDNVGSFIYVVNKRFTKFEIWRELEPFYIDFNTDIFDCWLK